MTRTGPITDLPVRELSESVYAHEKQILSSSDDENLESPLEKDSSVVKDYSDRESVQLISGEAVIRTGEDVSNILLDVRDDGDPALTFRSVVLGTVFAALGAAMCQVRHLR